MITKQNKYNAAVYCRLSSDDGQSGESGSIQTQKTLLTQYCKDHGFPVASYYCDDGWSGTNFQRPDFQRMMSDIDEGKINLVVVKDLSRFGREYAQMGIYIEHYFEENNVRFISVGENIDTINGTDNIMLPFTNVINSLYARDCSRKTKAAQRARAKDGKYMSGHPLFGYIKDPNDKHKLIIDPPAAEVIRKIFNMFAEGVGYVRMTKILREQKILNPQAYFNQNNPDYYKSDYWRQPFDWHATSVRSILNNEEYLGKTVFGKTVSKGFHSKKRIAVPREDWIVVEETHEPLITQETWDIVHKLMSSRRRECKKGEIQMFAGLVKCSNCGSSLNLSYDGRKQRYTSFSCWVYKNYGKERCTSHAIGWKTMCELVLDDIRRNAHVAKIMRNDYLDRLIKLRTDKQKKEIEQYKRELKSAEKRIGQLDTTITKLFESSALGRISEERYQTMLNAYESEQKQLKGRRDILQKLIGKAEEAYGNVENFVNLIRKFIDIQELDVFILNSLIDKIVVHEKETLVDGSKSQRVDIHYKFIGYLPMGEILASANSVNGMPLDRIIAQIQQDGA